MTIMSRCEGIVPSGHDPPSPQEMYQSNQSQLMYSNYPMPNHEQQQQLQLDPGHLEPNPLYLSLGSTGSSGNHSLPRSHNSGQQHHHQFLNQQISHQSAAPLGYQYQLMGQPSQSSNQDHRSHCRSLNSGSTSNSHQIMQQSQNQSSSSLFHPNNNLHSNHIESGSRLLPSSSHYSDQHQHLLLHSSSSSSQLLPPHPSSSSIAASSPSHPHLQPSQQHSSYSSSAPHHSPARIQQHNIQQSMMNTQTDPRAASRGVIQPNSRVASGPPTGTVTGLIQGTSGTGLIQGTGIRKVPVAPPPSSSSSSVQGSSSLVPLSSALVHQERNLDSTVMISNEGGAKDEGGDCGTEGNNSQVMNNPRIPSVTTGLSSTSVIHGRHHNHQQLLTSQQSLQSHQHQESVPSQQQQQLNHVHSSSSVNPFYLQSAQFDLRQQQQQLLQIQSRASPSSGSNQSGCDHHSSVSKSSSTALSSQALFLHNQVMNQQLTRQSQLTQSQIHSQQYLKSQLINQQQQQQQLSGINFNTFPGLTNDFQIQSTVAGLTPDQVNGYANGHFNHTGHQRVQGRNTLLQNGGNRVYQQQQVVNNGVSQQIVGSGGYATFNGPPVAVGHHRTAAINGSNQMTGIINGMDQSMMVNGDIYSQVNYGSKYNSRLNGHVEQFNPNQVLNQSQINGHRPAKEFMSSETNDGQQILACLDTSSATSSIKFRTKKKKKPTPFKPPPKPILATLHDLLLTSVTSGTNGQSHRQPVILDGTQVSNNHESSFETNQIEDSRHHRVHPSAHVSGANRSKLLNGYHEGVGDGGRITSDPSFTAIHHPRLVSMTGNNQSSSFEPVPPKVPTSNRPPVPIHRQLSNGTNKSQISPASTSSKHSMSSLTKITGCLKTPLSVSHLLNGHSPKSHSPKSQSINFGHSPKIIPVMATENHLLKVTSNPVVVDVSLQQSLVRPKCTNCSNVIVDEECTEAEGGVYHIKCFVCTNCSNPLGGCQYIMARDSDQEKEQIISYDNEWTNGDCIKRSGARLRPFCTPCYDSLFGEFCEGCGELIQVAKGTAICHDGRSWHATPDCFNCYNCSSSLLGLPFLPHSSGLIFCSISCSKEAFKVKPGRKSIKEERLEDVNEEEVINEANHKIEECQTNVSNQTKNVANGGVRSTIRPQPSSQSPTISSTCESSSPASSPPSSCSGSSPDCDPHLINPSANSISNPVTSCNPDVESTNPVSTSTASEMSTGEIVDGDQVSDCTKSRIPTLVPGLGVTQSGKSAENSNNQIVAGNNTCPQMSRMLPLSCNRSLSEVLEENEEDISSSSSDDGEDDVTSSSDSEEQEEEEQAVPKPEQDQEEMNVTANEGKEEKEIAKEVTGEKEEETKLFVSTERDSGDKRDKSSSAPSSSSSVVQVLRMRFEKGQEEEETKEEILTADRDYGRREIKTEERRGKEKRRKEKKKNGIESVTQLQTLPSPSSSSSSVSSSDRETHSGHEIIPKVIGHGRTDGHEAERLRYETANCGHNDDRNGQSPREEQFKHQHDKGNGGCVINGAKCNYVASDVNLVTNANEDSLTSSDNNTGTKVSPLPPNEVNVSIKSPKNVTFNQTISVMETSPLSNGSDLEVGHSRKSRRKVERKDSGRKGDSRRSGRKSRKSKDESDEEDVLTDSSSSSTTITDSSESSDTEEEDEKVGYATYRPTYRPAVKRQQDACVVQ